MQDQTVTPLFTRSDYDQALIEIERLVCLEFDDRPAGRR